jgi:serine/threonine protein kinase
VVYIETTHHDETLFYFNNFEMGETAPATREMENYKRITMADLASDIRISRLHGLVMDDDERLLGLLLTYIDCGYTTLSCAAHGDAPALLKHKWASQITETLASLHKAGLVWSDAKPDNVLIERNQSGHGEDGEFDEVGGEAWIIDFGGGYTHGFIDSEKAKAVEGDLQGLANILEYVFNEEDICQDLPQK